jgi:subtilase family serine protease
MRIVKSALPALLIASLFCSMSHAVVADRIPNEINASQMVEVKGNVHGLAQPQSDLGRADSGKMLHAVTLVFHPSRAQQQDLNNLLAQQQDRTSPNYHKWLTPAQFADRFGITPGDLQRVTSWLQSQGFAVTSVANSRNEISFEGTVSQIEATFQTEIHNYLVDGVVHFANSRNPSVPAALAGSVLAVGHLHDFAPRPRALARPHLTSYQTGNHFITPADFATIYDVAPMYNNNGDGTGQKIAIVGQSSVNPTDLSNFRSAAGLSANAPQMVLLSGTTSTRCSGDEGESDLDLEWSGGVAKNASIIFVYAGLSSGDTCNARNGKSVWDALDYAVQNKVAPFISTSYGFCEGGETGQTGVGQAFAQQVQGWAQQANSQGQTIVSASGDNGAADCDGVVTSATQGLAVDVPASIPEVTGMGGNTFTGDSTTNTPPGGDAPYWAAASATADLVSSALEYIPEDAWNDTNGGDLAASGGGASLFFSKPTWQTGTGVPADGKRDVPDLAVAASPNHDGYLICSEDDSTTGGLQSSCASAFRDNNGFYTVVGGTSVAAPTFSAILALINEQAGSPGFGNVNPTLYGFAASTPAIFHDVTAGNNKVACTSGTVNCPAGTTQIGFTAGTGYDQVTGLGSVDANKLATTWVATLAPQFSLTPTVQSFQVAQGSSVNAIVTLALNTGFAGTVTFLCAEPSTLTESSCSVPPPVNTSGQVSFHITTTLPTASLQPFERGRGIFYASLLPGLFGIVVAAGSPRSRRNLRLLGLFMVLGLATFGLGSCGGASSTNSNTSTPGTTRGTYTITVSATSPGAPTVTTSFKLIVQ